MPLRTVGFLAVLPSYLTSPTVFLMGHHLQVTGIHTWPVPTEVIRLQSFGNRTYQGLVRKAIGLEGPAPLPAPYPDLAVAIGDGCRPYPAGSTIPKWAKANLGPEPFW